jgi:hypothetical protein
MRDLLSRWPWLLLFVVGCVAEFFATWAKETAGERLRGGGDEEVGRDDD